MLLTMVTFNYAAADAEAEERHYLEYHVPLARQLPGLRSYYTGRLVALGNDAPAHHRAAVLTFDSGDARAAAMRTPTGTALAADTRAHLRDVTRIEADAEVIQPFDARRPGQAVFVMAGAFDLAATSGGANPDGPEHRYRDHHVAMARQLPGLRSYVIGKLTSDGGTRSDRYRIALLAFDTREALRDAYRSPLGRELREDERATILNARVQWLDARVEI